MTDLKSYFRLIASLGREEIMKAPEDYDICNPYVRMLIDGACEVYCGFGEPLTSKAMVLIHELLLLRDTFHCAFAYSGSKGYNMVIGMNNMTKCKLKDRYLEWLDADAPRLLSMPTYLREVTYCREILKEFAK